MQERNRAEQQMNPRDLIEHWRRPGVAWLGALFALIVSVPFCGWAFDCGCDWPWRGLATHCNYFAAESQDKCPWCVHTFLGMVAVAGSVAVGAVAGGYRPSSLLDTAFVIGSGIRFGVFADVGRGDTLDRIIRHEEE
ncbi:MAG: hypothetical protein ACHBNF_14065 [Chromatiales bacterium]